MYRLAVLLTLAAVVAVPTARSVPANTPASNGWIVFASDRVPLPYSSYGLYRLDPIGAKVTPLGLLAGVSPAWSPDGAWIAFSDRRQRLIVAAADGTRARRLTDRPVIAEQPSWSPDGSRIAFQHAIARAGGRRRHLAIINADGTGLRRLTRGRHQAFSPSWSPDGSLIAFASDRRRRPEPYGGEIYVLRPNGRGSRALTNNRTADFSPAWSPDGSLIAFSRREPGRGESELWTMRRDGTGQRRVQLASAPSAVWSEDRASWSPDGNWLVYASSEALYPFDIYMVRPDGHDRIDLTPGTNSNDFDPAWQPLCSHAGTPRSDSFRGSLADDRVCGFAGDDTLHGGAGRDGLYGGDGHDRLVSRDGSFDIVGCGGGRDRVFADRVDLVGVDCERIRRS